MTRISMRLTGIAIAAGLLLLVVAAPRVFTASQASAQTAPPAPPVVVYGTATGRAAGAGVVSIVDNAGKGVNCGTGLVKSEGTARVYVVQVAADSQKAGCGSAGRSITFYVTSGKAFTGTGGAISVQSVNWPTGQTSENNLTFGTPLTVRGFFTIAVRDGTR